MNATVSKNLVTIHACERFANRIMGIGIDRGSLSREQVKRLSNKIISIANECHPNMFNIGKGHFKCPRYDCTLVLEDGAVVTVKNYEKDRNSDYTGGIHKSGCKKKKLQWKKGGKEDGDLNPNNNKYPVSNGNRYDKKSKRKGLKEF